MPVTAKLSLLFYQKLGEQVATELVEWFNSVDATYRSDLRELNELNFARFDAKLEQRLAEFDGRVAQRFAQVDARFESLEARLLGRLESRIEGVRTEMQRWMLASWSSMMLVLLATLLAVLRTR
jgi:hypothetical protein